MSTPAASATFTGLVDLAAQSFGGRALGTSDDFFAGMENMLNAGRALFIDGKYTDRGKWMDGWESRRKRTTGHDFCVVELGALGEVLGFDIDTQHFVGNHPPFASVDGLAAEPGTTYHELLGLPWVELLAQSPLRPDSQNLFAALHVGPLSHVRLNIFPDGGVARFRVFGRVKPQLRTPSLDDESAAGYARPHPAGRGGHQSLPRQLSGPLLHGGHRRAARPHHRSDRQCCVEAAAAREQVERARATFSRI